MITTSSSAMGGPSDVRARTSASPREPRAPRRERVLKQTRAHRWPAWTDDLSIERCDQETWPEWTDQVWTLTPGAYRQERRHRKSKSRRNGLPTPNRLEVSDARKVG